jgi:hypothetical protein
MFLVGTSQLCDHASAPILCVYDSLVQALFYFWCDELFLRALRHELATLVCRPSARVGLE